MRAHGGYAFLSRAASRFSPARSPRVISFDEHRANRLVVANETLAGRVEEPVLGREAKRPGLEEYALRNRLGLEP